MSLKEAAKYLESQGRGNDSRLMHVTPSELQGLQSLAMAKGGSLTINPQTGLPEAGFLEDILPVAAAGAAMYFAPGLAPALGGAFGASGALATGIGAGLIAGGSSLLTQALSGQPMNVGKAATTGALTGITAGAFAPSTNVLTETPALELAKQTANAPIVQGDFSTAPLNLPSAQPPVLGANPTASEYASWDKYLGTDQVPGNAAKSGNWFSDLTGKEKLGIGLGGTALLSLLGSQNQQKIQAPSTSTSYIRPYTYSQTRNPNYGQPGQSYYNQSYTAQPIYQAAQGGLMAVGGPVEEMSQHSVGKNTYPMSTIDASAYSTPFQSPIGTNVISSQYDIKTNPFSGEPLRMAEGGSANSGYIPTSQAVQDYNKMLSERAAEEYLRNPMPTPLMPASKRQALMPQMTKMYGDASQSPVSQAGLPQYTYDPRTQRYTPVAQQAPIEQQPIAVAPNPMDGYGGGKAGGLMPYNLGGYSDGGRLLKGPGDGMSDNIPASIGNKQPARLADGEFVVPADVVSHLGNGSTDAGAKKLYSMMDKVRTARVGNKKQGKQIKAEKYLPA
jgi:hypothetical protein